MKNLQLLLLNFRKKKWFNLIIMIEITIAIILFILVLGKINYYTEPLRVFDEKKLENVFIYGINEMVPLDKKLEKQKEFEKIFEKNKDKLVGFGTTYSDSINFNIGETGNEQYEQYTLKKYNNERLFNLVLTYDLAIGKNFNLSLDSGKNFSQIKLEKDMVPAILNNDLKNIFKIGDIIDVKYSGADVNNARYEELPDGNILQRISTIQIPIKIKVIGFLNESNSAFSLDGDGMVEYYPMDLIYQREHEEDMILLRTSDNPLGQIINPAKTTITYLIEIKPKYISEKQAIMDEFNTIGSTYTFEKIIEGQKKELKLNIKIPMINLIIAMIITIISIAGLNVLLKVSEKKKYGIYYACGCTWKKCVILDILKGVLLIIIPTMLAFTVATMIDKKDKFMVLTPSVYIWGLVIAGLIYFVSDFLFNLKMYKTKPVDNLREVE